MFSQTCRNIEHEIFIFDTNLLTRIRISEKYRIWSKWSQTAPCVPILIGVRACVILEPSTESFSQPDDGTFAIRKYKLHNFCNFLVSILMSEKNLWYFSWTLVVHSIGIVRAILHQNSRRHRGQPQAPGCEACATLPYWLSLVRLVTSALLPVARPSPSM